jgi:hypothetical protein
MSVQWTNRFWAASLDLILLLDFFETFSEHAPRNKLRESTNFIIFGPTDEKLWRNEKFGRSMDMAGKCWSQLA